MPGPYPKTFYHPDGRHVEVKDANGESDLGNDWYDDHRIADAKRNLTDADIAIFRGRQALVAEQDKQGQGFVVNSHAASQAAAAGHPDPATAGSAVTEPAEKPAPASPALPS